MAAVLNMAEGGAPSTPAANTHSLYVDTSGNWHTVDDGGVNKTLANTDIAFVTANITDLNVTTGKLADAAVTNAKLADMAEATIKGRAAAAGTGVPTDLTAAQLATILAAYLTGGTTDAAWTNASSFGTYWTASGTEYPSGATYAAPGYRLVNGIVYLRGAVTCSSNTSSAVFTLPTGYRPASRAVFAIAIATASSITTEALYIEDDGRILIPDDALSTTYHLDSISFVPA